MTRTFIKLCHQVQEMRRMVFLSASLSFTIADWCLEEKSLHIYFI